MDHLRAAVPLGPDATFSPTSPLCPDRDGLGSGSAAWHLRGTPPFPSLPACWHQGEGRVGRSSSAFCLPILTLQTSSG